MGKQQAGKSSTPSWRAAAPSGDKSSRSVGKRWSQRSIVPSALSSHAWKLRISFGAFILLLICLTWILLTLLRPRTNIVAIAVTNNSFPTKPNGWVTEDIKSLSELTKGLSGTIAVRNLSADWRNDRNTGMDAFRAALKKVKKRKKAIFYISAIGLVNDEGQPCLLPPNTSSLEPANFITVESLIDEIVKEVPNPNKLLVLDASQVLVDWNMGILYNTFGERLEKLLQDKAVPNLSVLVSASPGQRSWASPEIGGTAFGKFFQLGIAGLADGFTGKRDGRVQVLELEQYLAAHVDNWSRANRGERQIPRIYDSAQNDFVLTQTNSSRRRLWEEFKKQDAVKSTATNVTSGLWKKLGELSKYQPVRYAPKRVRELQRRLLWTEQLTDAGAEYAEMAKSTFDELDSELTSLTSKAAELGKSPCVVDRWNIIDARTGLEGLFGSGVNQELAENRLLPTLSLNEYFGLASTQQVRDLSTSIDSIKSQNGSLSIDSHKPEARLEVAAWLGSAHVEKTALLWASQPNILDSVYKLRFQLEDLGVPFDDASDSSSRSPGDERSHGAVRKSLAEAMELQRELEDLIFLGDRDAGSATTELMDLVKERIALVKKLRQSATDATLASHIAWQRLPYIANWQCSSFAVGDEALQKQKSNVARLVELIRLNKQLGAAGDDDEQAIATLGPVVKRELNEIQTAMKDEIEQLDKFGSGDVASFHGLSTTLRLPFPGPDEEDGPDVLPAELRLKFAKLVTEVRDDLHRDYLEGVDEVKQLVGDTNSTNDRLNQIASWANHPVVELICSDIDAVAEASAANGTTDWERLETVNKFVRRKFAVFSKPKASSTDTTKPFDTISQHRKQLLLEEQSLRSAISLLGQVDSSWDPVGRLRNLDLKRLLIWHRAQIVEGMWRAPWDGSGRTFTRRATEDCKREIRRLRNSGDALLEQKIVQELAEQDELLKNRLDASFSVAANSSTSPDGTIGFEVAISEAKAGFSPGRAAVYAENQGVRQGDLRFSNGVKLPITGQIPEFKMDVPIGKVSGDELLATVFFRGRRTGKTSTLDPFDGLLVDYVPHQYGPPSVKLSGSISRRNSLSFVLDCSPTMDSEITGGRKIDLAKQHLSSMLKRLSMTDAKVGLFFFGHRSTYKRTNGVYAHDYQQSWPREIPKGLLPALDVEEVRPLGEFDDNAHADIANKLLPHIVPWGQSPVYLALNRSFERFRPVDAERQGIIAITDGDNYQRTSTADKPAPTEADLKFAGLKLKLEGQPGCVPVHIIDVGKPKAGNRLPDIADMTGGTYVSARSGTDLLRALEEQIQLDGYFVTDVNSSQPINKEKRQLNRTVRFSKAQFTGKDYQVEFRDQPSNQFVLEGGEALQLRATETNSRIFIESEKYPLTAEASGDLVFGNDRSTGTRVSVERPMRSNNDVSFTLSMQGPLPDCYTKRPRETWMEVTPLIDGTESEQSFVFYDANLVPDTPVPELRWTVNDWPRADRAMIKFWCKNVESTPTVPKQISLRELTNTPGRYADYFDSEVAPGVELKIAIDESARVINVVQRHPRDSAFTIRIGFSTTSKLVPSRVRRQFDSRIATHKFYFNEASWEMLQQNADNTFLEYASRRDCLDGAMGLKQPLEVTVSGEAGFSNIGD